VEEPGKLGPHVPPATVQQCKERNRKRLDAHFPTLLTINEKHLCETITIDISWGKKKYFADQPQSHESRYRLLFCIKYCMEW
jgi:hypothetical protein